MIIEGTFLMGLLFIGGLLGLLYFGGLWITLLKLPTLHHPIIVLSWSYIIRLGLVLGAFHLQLQWIPQEKLLPALLVSFVGFLFVRIWLITRLSFKNKLNHRAGGR